MFALGSLVAEGYARLAAHPITAAAVGSSTAFVISWLLTQTRSRM